MYSYYAEIEECERQISLYVYGTEDVDYKQAKELQRFFDTKEVIEYYHKHNSWILAISEYIVKLGIQISDKGLFISFEKYD